MNKKILVAVILTVVVLGLLVGSYFVFHARGVTDGKMQALQYQTITCQALWVQNNQLMQTPIQGCSIPKV